MSSRGGEKKASVEGAREQAPRSAPMIASRRSQVRMRKNAGLGSLVLVLAGAPSTRAGEIPPQNTEASVGPEVVVQCSVLSEEERASVEARARADLAIKGLAGGVLSVTCAEGLGRVSFRWGALEGT